MIEGERVNIGGREFVIPPLNIRLLKKHQASLDDLTNPNSIKSMGISGYALKAIPVLTENLQRNYPELTEDEIADLLPVGDVGRVVKAMFYASGFQGEEKAPPLAPDVSPSTGTSSSGAGSQQPAGP